MRTESGSVLYGDWRSSAYGATRRAHLFTPGRHAACGANIRYDRTAAVRRRALMEVCYDCLAHGASGR